MAISRKKKEQLLANYQEVKTDDYFNFERISGYRAFEKEDSLQQLSDHTERDLDFEELFMYADRTCSKVGQQYLYQQLRTIPKDDARVTQMEELIAYYEEHPGEKEKMIVDLHRLNKPATYYLKSLIHDQHLPKPKWYPLIWASSLLSLGATIGVFFYPPLTLLLMLLFAVNFFIHYWNKNNITVYSNAVPQLLILHRLADKIRRNGPEVVRNQGLTQAVNKLKSIRQKASIFKMEAVLESELAQAAGLLLELIYILYLLQPLVLFRMLDQLEQHRREIAIIFEAVGAVDVAISVNSFRKGLSNYCKPQFTDKSKQIRFTAMYHPLISEPVTNDLSLTDRKSVLISGSNMSGKTTFIRMLGLNTLLAQTINTAMAASFELPRMGIQSAIRISDNLLNDKSYYLEEVLTIKEMLKLSEEAQPYLFLLDELYKGTNTIERVAAGKSVLTHLNRGNHLAFAATHDLELTDLLKSSFSNYHFSEVIENNELSFDYQLKDGILKNTNAIKILEINEYPADLISEARRLSQEMIEQKTLSSN